MKTKIFILALLLCLIGTNTIMAVSISSPTNNSVYRVGQTLTVEVQPDQNENIEQLILVVSDIAVKQLSSPPYRMSLLLKENSLGRQKVGAIAKLKNGSAVQVGIDINVKLDPEIKIKEIKLEKDLYSIFLNPRYDNTREITAKATYSDGIIRDINASSEISYISNNTNIAEVDSYGVITGKSPGNTKVTLATNNISTSVKVFVEYKVDEVKNIQGIKIDNKNEITWSKADYEGDIVTGYKIFRSKHPKGINKVFIGEVSAGNYKFIDSNVDSKVIYYYSVQAYSSKYNTGSSMKTWVAPR